ncbi:MAG: GNAT family N-acetyltransferase [Acidobacteriia bacterium]|nr:GNAT family N-acetyltransferase [Terriglobia bacterium]
MKLKLASRYNVSVAILRPYQPQDFTRLLEIDQSCFVEGIAYTEEEIRYFLAMPGASALVAEDAEDAEGPGQILGFIIADRFRPRRTSPYMGRIITIDVLPQAQGSGVGALLMAGAEAQLKQGECDLVCLEVAVDNPRAIRFYKKHGYTVLKTLPRYYLDSIDGLLMVKKL